MQVVLGAIAELGDVELAEVEAAARDTIEEKVVAHARRKAARFSGVMDDGDLFAGSPTAHDIRGLLR